MYWKIHLPEPKRFPKGRDFAPRGPRKKAEDNLEARIKAVSGLEIEYIENTHCPTISNPKTNLWQGLFFSKW